jgi:hypothetical protein
MVRRCANAVAYAPYVSAVKFAVPDSCGQITSGEGAGAFPSALPASLKWEGHGRVTWQARILKQNKQSKSIPPTARFAR